MSTSAIAWRRPARPPPSPQVKTARKTLAKAQRKTNVGALDRLAERVDGQWQIKDEPPLIERAEVTPELRERLGDFYKQYLESLPKHLLPLMHHYKVVDFARKVVGVGSVGTQAFVLLLIGTRHGDALFLQLKEADDSVSRALHRSATSSSSRARVSSSDSA